MRSFLFVICFLPVLSYAQREYTIAFEKSIPPGLGEPFRLPAEPEHLPDVANYGLVTRIHIVASQQAYKKAFPRYIYTIDSIEKFKNDDWYYKLLLQYLVDSLPAIDFEKKELVIFSGCGQCLAYCSHETGYHPCHRNGCMNMYKAFLRDKKYNLSKVTGEKKNFLQALYAIPPDGTTERIDMSRSPKREVLEMLVTDKRSSYLFKINDSVFRKIYAWELQFYSSNVPLIDFSQQELWVRLVCHQCLIYCEPDKPGWDNRPCHKGDCVYDQKWYVKQFS